MQEFFHVITFGCQMNVNDSDWLKNSLKQKGYTENVLEHAGIIILNTCSVRDKPEQKVYNTLNRISFATNNNPDIIVVVAGCVAQQIGSKFFEKFPQVRLVVGSDGMASALSALERLKDEPNLKLCLTDFSETYPERNPVIEANTDMASAYVNIMQGCDNYCAYCIVPYTRGRPKSRSSKAILEECKILLSNNVKEITLLGQNVNSFGQDSQGDGTSFVELLYAISALPNLERLRFVTAHPKDISPELIAAYTDLEVLCPRLHLPMQSGSDAILKSMGRIYNIKKYLNIVDNLLATRADAVLSTDLIVGFPGETEQDFLETCTMVEKVKFVSSFSFCYSDRPGTKAEMLKDKIPQKIKLERLNHLQNIQDNIAQIWLKARLHTQTKVLLEGLSRKQSPENMQDPTQDTYVSWQGKDPYGTTINLNLSPKMAKKGLILPVHIIDAKRHSLLAKVITL